MLLNPHKVLVTVSNKQYSCASVSAEDWFQDSLSIRIYQLTHMLSYVISNYVQYFI